MAVSGNPSGNFSRSSSGFMTLLSKAACEWFLMFLMFVDAALSYLLTKFAFYCELQTPCILCSRLDHVFGNEKPGFYRSLLCSSHKEEISSTIGCQIHDKLSDIRGMCEECLMSMAMQKKPSLESYKLMVGKLGMDFERCGFQGPYSKKNFVSPLGTRTCSCCNKPLRTKTNVQRLLQLTPAGFGASRANVRPPLPRVPGRSRLSHRDNLKRIRDKITGSVTSPRSGISAETESSNIGYSELRITSDSESEVPFSDDDDGSSVYREKFDSNESFLSRGGSEKLPRNFSMDKATPMKQIREASLTSILDKNVQLDANKSNVGKALASNVSIVREIGALNQEQHDPKPIPSALPELISLDDVPSSADKSDAPLSQMSGLDALSELISLKVVPPKSTAAEVPLGVPTLDVPQAGFPNEATPFKSNDSDLLNVRKSAVADDYVKDDKIVKPPPPITPINHDELQKNDASSPDGVQVIHSSALLDRHDSGYESADMSCGSEIEGENVVERLKRQVEYDRKCMSSLYKELEEERNASAIAANQAMAMITRLQEEKAALQMESLQYLRMMEEQAEYDMDALGKANDLLAEKEREIEDLEIELELYRNNLGDESAVEHLPSESSFMKVERKTVPDNDIAGTRADATVPSSLRSDRLSERTDKSMCARSCFLDFEDEKLYITRCLKDLESKLQRVHSNISCSGKPNGVCSENITNGEKNLEGTSNDRGRKTDHQNEVSGLSNQEDATTSNGRPSDDEKTVASVEDKQFVSEENHFDSKQEQSSTHHDEIDISALDNEISDLNDRLEALEVDHDFLEHIFNSVRNGKDGLEFLEDIARQLQELRKVEFGRR